MSNEKRLISADNAISHYKALANIEWNQRVSAVSWADAYEDFVAYLEDAPTVDAVEVVRCKNCRWAEDFSQSYLRDLFADGALNCAICRGDSGYGLNCSVVLPNDFCSDGERRNDV